jgi:hypothetical protein
MAQPAQAREGSVKVADLETVLTSVELARQQRIGEVPSA